MALEFADLEKLPDDVKYTLADGTEVTLGDVRKAALDHVNKRISDLTPREQKLVSREQQVEEAEKRVRETMALLANTPPQPPPTPQPQPGQPAPPLGYTNEQWQAILADPYSRPLVTTLAQLAAETEELKKMVRDNVATQQQKEELARQQQENQWINYQLDTLGVKDVAERRQLIEYAQDILKRRDISAIHRARNYDTAVKQAEEAGYQRGMKEGKGAAPIPSIPHGTRSVPTPPAPEKLPATFNEFADSAANDAQLIQEIREAASSPSPPNQ